MKPSDKILKLVRKKFGDVASDYEYICGIMAYLDEEYEKNKPCEHKSAYQVDSSLGDVYYNVCNDCGVLFLAKEELTK